jgi:hypothetical protein
MDWKVLGSAEALIAWINYTYDMGIQHKLRRCHYLNLGSFAMKIIENELAVGTDIMHSSCKTFFNAL